MAGSWGLSLVPKHQITRTGMQLTVGLRTYYPSHPEIVKQRGLTTKILRITWKVVP